MAFGAVFAAILAVVAAATDVDRDAGGDDDPADVVDSADPGVAQPVADAAQPRSIVAQVAPAAPRLAVAPGQAPVAAANASSPSAAAPAAAPVAAGQAASGPSPSAVAQPRVAPAKPPAGVALADSAPLLLDRADRSNGWAMERLLEPSGDIVEHEVNRAGTVQSCRTVGSLFTLRVLEQKAAAGGEVVQVVRDASGALLRFAVGPDGEPRAVALLAPPPR